MSTDHPITHKSTAAWYLGIAAGLTVALGLALAVGNAGHADTAAGIVTGGMLVVVLAATGRLRSSRAADRAGTATRLAAGRPDERDVRVHQGSLAILGICLLYTSDAADDLLCVDLGGRR